jgi:hypothetical protein
MNKWAVFKELLKQYARKYLASLGGLRARLALFIADAIIKIVVKFLQELENKLREGKEAKDELDVYKRKINDPNSKAEDIRDAGRDFIK